MKKKIHRLREPFEERGTIIRVPIFIGTFCLSSRIVESSGKSRKIIGGAKKVGNVNNGIKDDASFEISCLWEKNFQWERFYETLSAGKIFNQAQLHYLSSFQL